MDLPFAAAQIMPFAFYTCVSIGSVSTYASVRIEFCIIAFIASKRFVAARDMC